MSNIYQQLNDLVEMTIEIRRFVTDMVLLGEQAGLSSDDVNAFNLQALKFKLVERVRTAGELEGKTPVEDRELVNTVIDKFDDYGITVERHDLVERVEEFLNLWYFLKRKLPEYDKETRDENNH